MQVVGGPNSTDEGMHNIGVRPHEEEMIFF